MTEAGADGGWGLPPDISGINWESLMQVTKRVKVDFVQYRGAKDGVLINVTPQLVDEAGNVVGTLPFENVHTTQDELTAKAAKRGEKVWGDPDVDETILTATRSEPIPEDEREEPAEGEEAVTHRDVLRFPDSKVVW